MTDYTKMFNEFRDRRTQELSFVGQDRRKIIENAEAQLAHEANTQAFLTRAQNIDGVKRIA